MIDKDGSPSCMGFSTIAGGLNVCRTDVRRTEYVYYNPCVQKSLKGQCHEIILTRFFSSITSFLSYWRYSMGILNFSEFSLCYSTKKELAGVGYTGESGLLGVGYTGKSGLTGESLVDPSRPANALKGTVP